MTTAHLIDIGANLSHESFAHDLDAVFGRAQDVGVDTFILTGTSIKESRAALDLARQYAHCYSTAGIHPHDAKSLDKDSIPILRELAADVNVVAIGECGLDYNRNFSTPEQQRIALEEQLALAVELQMPVFLHERDAADDMQAILREYRDDLVDAVIHCFTGVADALDAYLAMDLHIGITGWICDERRGHHLHEIVDRIPLNRLMLETDAPYLMPRDYPHKKSLHSSRRNEPCTLPHTAQRVAQCMSISDEALLQSAFDTSRAFFRLP